MSFYCEFCQDILKTKQFATVTSNTIILAIIEIKIDCFRPRWTILLNGVGISAEGREKKSSVATIGTPASLGARAVARQPKS